MISFYPQKGRLVGVIVALVLAYEAGQRLGFKVPG